MIVANGGPRDAVGTQLSYVAFVGQFNVDRAQTPSGNYEGNFNIDAYVFGERMHSVQADNTLSPVAEYDNNSALAYLHVLRKANVLVDQIDLPSFRKSQLVCEIDPATLPGIPASFANIVRKGKIWRGGREQLLSGGLFLTYPQIDTVFEFEAEGLNWHARLMLVHNSQSDTEIDTVTGAPVPTYSDIPTTGMGTFLARGKAWEFDWADMLNNTRGRWRGALARDGNTELSFGGIAPFEVRTISITQITEVGNPDNTGDNELAELQAEEMGSISPKASNTPDGIGTAAKLKLFECNYLPNPSDRVIDILRVIADSMHDALPFEVQGKVGLSVVHPTTEAEFDAQVVAHITDNDLISLSENMPKLSRQPDRVIVKFRNEETNFADDSVAFPEDNTVAYHNVVTINTEAITDPYHARAKAEHEYRSHRFIPEWEAITGPWLYHLNVGDFVTIESERYVLGLTRARVWAASLEPNGRVELGLRIYRVSDSAWNVNKETDPIGQWREPIPRDRAPTPVAEFFQTPRRVELTWMRHSFSQTAIQRRIGTDGAWQDIGIVEGVQHTVTDLPESAGSVFFRLRFARDGGGLGIPSLPVEVVINAAGMGPPGTPGVPSITTNLHYSDIGSVSNNGGYQFFDGETGLGGHYENIATRADVCLLYTSPSPRDS